MVPSPFRTKNYFQRLWKHKHKSGRNLFRLGYLSEQLYKGFRNTSKNFLKESEFYQNFKLKGYGYIFRKEKNLSKNLLSFKKLLQVGTWMKKWPAPKSSSKKPSIHLLYTPKYTLTITRRKNKSQRKTLNQNIPL